MTAHKSKLAAIKLPQVVTNNSDTPFCFVIVEQQICLSGETQNNEKACKPFYTPSIDCMPVKGKKGMFKIIQKKNKSKHVIVVTNKNTETRTIMHKYTTCVHKPTHFIKVVKKQKHKSTKMVKDVWASK